MRKRDSDSAQAPGIGAGYAAFQLSKALLALSDSLPPEARTRAAKRVERWQQVVAHALGGSAQYGSRTPLPDVPAWVTLEVSTGGFATGQLLAGGDLTEYERHLAAALPSIRSGAERLDINAWHLTDEGLAALRQQLVDGNYRVDVPEAAALPTVAWLLGEQRVDEARSLIETLAPFFDRLRFFPLPGQGLPVLAAQVQVSTAGKVRQHLARLPAQPRLAVQKRVIEQRLPLYDAAISHFLLTYADDWPCQHYPPAWPEQAAQLGIRFDTMCRAGTPAKGRVVELYARLGQCAQAPQTLTRNQLARVRQIIADFVRKHGRPGSATHLAQRARQQAQIAAPGYHRVAAAVAERMTPYPSEAGIRDFAPLLHPITPAESQVFEIAAGVLLPEAVRRRLERCRRGTIAELVDYGLITSGETVAKVLPAMTAEIHGAGFQDPALRKLYAATYQAFRRRRSLLLLDLQHQVALNELPWVAVLKADAQPQAVTADIARQALVEASATTLGAFPQALVPNKLLQEFDALAKAAGLSLPFVNEVATDIFMGAFSNTFIEAARRAAGPLTGTLYARYFDIDTQALAALPDRPKAKANAGWRRTPDDCDALAKLCVRRAGAEQAPRNPATNGTIVEQQQILTTQNLVPLLCELDVQTLLRPKLGPMALACFEWICLRQQIPLAHHPARLAMLKNTAYAWRQMLFYLSLLDEPASGSAIADIERHFAAQPALFRERFLPVMMGLRVAAAGRRLPQGEVTTEGARVFLGWSSQRHWLMPRP
ncbi:hypothetical protein [Pseudomonas sp. UBA6562]|uniref:hypothetical protein n=1 Tax=Pseudomonas sp. UBA6562 TaxID=1947332 RepID=UPI0025D19850|nr:hypothetical protein [Pseudomonas sp. UBA6562]